MRWEFKNIDQAVVDEVVRQTLLPRPIAQVLAMRNLPDAAARELFLDPRLARLSDPFLLPDMESAVERIWAAIDGGEKITIFGDYDVDGVTSCALLTRVLLALGASVQPFIPDRLDEGYGLSQDALDRCLKLHGSTLVITVDCGTNSVDSVAHSQEHGVDIIVTDHHEPDAQTATAFALVNPKLGTNCMLQMLSGVGVAFKLAHALTKAGRTAGKEAAKQVNLRHYLDIVALGTAADMVPLLGENRILVRYGLAALDTTRWEGLRALKVVAGIRDAVDTYHLGFQLGPRINAAGRIGQPMQALALLLTDAPAEAREIAELLDQTNLERRRLEQEMTEQAFAEIDTYFNPKKHFGLVVAQSDWHPGVVGIVASRISRHYNRPAIVLGMDETAGEARGSCRSIAAFDVLGGLRVCATHLIKFGGHKMAAGLTLKSAEIPAFREDFNAAAQTELTAVDLTSTIQIDAIVASHELNQNFFDQLQQLHPFGEENFEPIWALRNVTVHDPRVVGEKHLKFFVKTVGQTLEAIAFNYTLKQLPAGTVDLAFTLKENRWNGRINLQLQIKSIRLSHESCSMHLTSVFRS